jgi:hypothetical protein
MPIRGEWQRDFTSTAIPLGRQIQELELDIKSLRAARPRPSLSERALVEGKRARSSWYLSVVFLKILHNRQWNRCLRDCPSLEEADAPSGPPLLNVGKHDATLARCAKSVRRLQWVFPWSLKTWPNCRRSGAHLVHMCFESGPILSDQTHVARMRYDHFVSQSHPSPPSVTGLPLFPSYATLRR